MMVRRSVSPEVGGGESWKKIGDLPRRISGFCRDWGFFSKKTGFEAGEGGLGGDLRRSPFKEGRYFLSDGNGFQRKFCVLRNPVSSNHENPHRDHPVPMAPLVRRACTGNRAD
jgi:hypothetical protein